MKKQVLFPSAGNLFTTIKGGRSQMIHSFSTFLLFGAILLCGVQSAWGQIAQRGSATTNSVANSNGTTLSITKPTGVVSGDVMLLTIVQNETDNDNGGLASPTLSGWSIVKDGIIRSDGTTNNSNLWFGSVYYRIADGTEGSSFSLAMHSRCDMAIGTIVAFSGVATNALKPDGTTGGPFDLAPVAFNTTPGATSAVTATGVTVATNNSAVVMLAMVNNDRTFSAWSNSRTEIFENTTTNGDKASVGAAWSSCATSGATGNGTATIDGSRYISSLLVVLRRASELSVGSASSTPTVCINTALTSITHTTTGATGIGTASGLPAGVTAAWASNTITISGTPTESGTFNYSIPLTVGCVNATGTITVTAANTAGTASSTPTVCVNTALTNITRTTTGATGIGTATGLPAGVTAAWASNTLTISGTPSATGTFNYSIPLTGGCGSVNATGTITVIQHTVGSASSTPTLCVNTALTNITHTTTGTTGIGSATGLPAGVTAAWASNTITISGTPTQSGTFNYSIPLTGGCVSATGTITVTAANTAGTASSTPTLCINTALTNITRTTTGATGIGTATGLPSGVTAAWASNTLTISGTPSAAGTFNYSIPLTGGCGSVNATGTITVTAANTAGLASSTPTVCINTAITSITHATTGATGRGTATGLPAGVTAAWASNTLTISGTPTAAGTFNYSIPLTGGCGSVNATGTITVTATKTAGTASSTPTLCTNTALTNITRTTTGATGIGTATGLPAGVTAAWASNTLTISGTPTASGTFNYSIPLTGGCGSVNATGTITVSPLPTAAVSASNSSICAGTEIDLTSTVNSNNSSGTVAYNGFESGNTWGYTNSNGSTKTGTSGTGDRPASTSFVNSGTTSFWVNNGTATVSTSNITGLSGYTNKVLTFNLAAFSMGSTSNGMDGGDNVTLEVSLDNGSTYSSEIVISGNSNAYWGFGTGTGTATATYDGDNSPNSFAPNGGGSRTTDGFSTITLNLPNSAQQTLIRITLANSSGSEAWLIDNLSLSGTPNASLSWVSSPTGFTSTAQNPTDLTPSENTTYTVTATNASGCTATASADVTVNTVTASSPLNVGDRVWNGKVSNDYTAIENWSQYNGTSLVAAQSAPTSNTNVVIPNVTQTCVLNTPSLLNNTVNADDLTIELDGELTIGTGNLNIRGDYTNNGSLTPGTGTVSFMGTSGNQTITKAGGETFANMKVTKASGDVILANNVTVTSELSLIKGLLVLGSNDLILGSANLTDHSSQSYVKTSSTGALKRNVGSSMVAFPVGDSTYNTAELTNTGAQSDVFSVRLLSGPTSSTNSSIRRTWMIEEATTGGSNVTMRLYWNAGDESSDFTSSTGATFIDHYTSGSGSTYGWANSGGTAGVSNGNNYVQTSGIQSFSPFTVSRYATALPVELMTLDAQCAGENVIVAWKTASEHNSLNFIVECSEDGTSWNEIQTVAAAGNSNTVLDYAIEDAGAARGLKYYRLIQTDQDGVQKIYGPVMSNCGSDDNSFVSFPNPSEGEMTLVINGNNFNGSSILHVRDANGRMVRAIALEIQAGTTSVLIPDMELTPGVYYLQLEGDNYTSKTIKHSLR